jgi:hypothetical protein
MLLPDTEINGPFHSLYPKLVVPAGTEMWLKTMVEQVAFDLLAAAASVNVQLAARYCNLPTVWGVRGGVAATDAATLNSTSALWIKTMLTDCDGICERINRKRNDRGRGESDSSRYNFIGSWGIPSGRWEGLDRILPW